MVRIEYVYLRVRAVWLQGLRSLTGVHESGALSSVHLFTPPCIPLPLNSNSDAGGPKGAGKWGATRATGS